MKSLANRKTFVMVLLLAWLMAACSPGAAQNAPKPVTEPPLVTLHTFTPTTLNEKVVSLGTPLPVETAESDLASGIEGAVPSARGGFVVFDSEKGEVQAYLPDGSQVYRIPAPGIQYPSAYNMEVVDGAVYYLPDQSEKFVRASPSGLRTIDIPANFMSKIAVSPDDGYIAWSMFDPTGSTSLWVGQLDSNHNVLDAREVARYTVQQAEAFSLSPIEWTGDGRLLFERGLTGIGGYILFGGHNSLYSYNPVTQEIATIIPAEEQHGLCLESYRPDLEKVLFNCSKEGPEIVIRDLNNGYTDHRVPRLPEQGVAGSAQFSPSGQRLAYAIARSNPDNESGEVVVATADLSSSPIPIAGVADNTYPAVVGWLDEDTILFSQTQWPKGTLWSVRFDGSDLHQVSDGMFIGWIQ